MKQLAVERLGSSGSTRGLVAPRRTYNHQWNLRDNSRHSEQQVLQEGVCGCNTLEDLCVPVQVHAHLAESPVEWICVNVTPRDLARREDVATLDKCCSVPSTEVWQRRK